MAFNAFLKLEGIPGDSTVEGHEDEIQIESFAWGVANSSAVGGGGASAGRASFQDFSFTADSSTASPLLFLHCQNGTRIDDGLLTLRGSGAGGQAVEFYTVKLSEVTISGYNQAGSVEGDHPMDEFALRYEKIELNYEGVQAIGGPGPSPVK